MLDPQKDGPIGVPLTIHPGILQGPRQRCGPLGGRVAFDINGASWGFMPLLNKGFPMGSVTWFVEAVVPIRFQDDAVGETHTAIGFAYTPASPFNTPHAEIRASGLLCLLAVPRPGVGRDLHLDRRRGRQQLVDRRQPGQLWWRARDPAEWR